MPKSEAKDLLRKSGGLFVRYFTRSFPQPTEFWYSACGEYDFEKLSRKARNQVRRARKNCEVRRIDAIWLAEHGYGCYSAAFARHGRSPFRSEAKLRSDCLADAAGPFEFWGVFVGDKLAGFTKCAVGSDYVAMVVAKFDPQYLAFYPAYALMDAMLAEYAGRRRMPVTNGFRPIAHDTNMQGFLEKFGFRKIFCDLRIVYRPLVRLCVDLLLPLRRVVARLNRPAAAANIKALLAQELIQRSFS